MNSRISLAVFLGAGLLAQAQDFTLDNLPTLHNFQSHRITSADPTGGNDDWRRLEPSQTLVLAEIHGPGCITQFRDNITGNEPSVEVPVGDFFGIGFGLTEKYHSALFAIGDRRGKLTDPAASGAARNCYIPMPFKRAARLTITNLGKQPSTHWFEVNYRSYAKAPKDQGYFHAQYRQGTPPPVAYALT